MAEDGVNRRRFAWWLSSRLRLPRLSRTVRKPIPAVALRGGVVSRGDAFYTAHIAAGSVAHGRRHTRLPAPSST